MEGGYLVPANTKKSTLIMGFMRGSDLLLFLIGLGISVIAFLLTDSDNLFLMIIDSFPMLICLGLVLPIPNYHNVLEVIKSVLNYYNGRRKYIWKGWCMRDEFKN